jgi:hypothetical protein
MIRAQLIAIGDSALTNPYCFTKIVPVVDSKSEGI